MESFLPSLHRLSRFRSTSSSEEIPDTLRAERGGSRQEEQRRGGGQGQLIVGRTGTGEMVVWSGEESRRELSSGSDDVKSRREDGGESREDLTAVGRSNIITSSGSASLRKMSTTLIKNVSCSTATSSSSHPVLSQFQLLHPILPTPLPESHHWLARSP